MMIKENTRTSKQVVISRNGTKEFFGFYYMKYSWNLLEIMPGLHDVAVRVCIFKVVKTDSKGKHLDLGYPPCCEANVIGCF